jgi:hypothetical protein
MVASLRFCGDSPPSPPYSPSVDRRSWVAVSGLLAGLLAGLLGLTGCSSGDGSARRPLHLQWQEVSLPLPPGPAGRFVVRDATPCAGSWYLVGAVAGTDGSTRPAAWTSADGRTWRSLAVEAHQYYARRAILYAVACRAGAVAVLGARSGGAHGNPRVTAWHQRADGALQDVRVPFELFGGPNAIAVSRIAAGAGGWMIAGGRTSGAAVWLSRDATTFQLVDDDPALSSDATRRTNAWDVTAGASGWTAAGWAQVSGRVAPVPMAWSSTDGRHWRRQEVPPATAGFADLERVVDVGDRVLAVGIRGDRFGTWERLGDQWRAAAVFGALDPRRSSAPNVSGLAAGPPGALTTVSDGVHVRLWFGDRRDRWDEVVMPTRPLGSGDRQTTVAADARDVLLVSDDGTSGRVWLADWNTLRR